MPGYSSIRGSGFAFLLLLWSLWFLIMLVRTILGPLLPLIEDEFVISHAKATSLVMVTSLGASTSLFASGVFSGRFGYKKSILLYLAVSMVVFLLIPHARAFSQIAALFFVFGMVTGAYFPCVIPIVTEHYAPSAWGRALAIQDTGASLSVFAGPLLVSLLAKFLSWRQFFTVFAAAYVTSGVLFLLFSKEVRVESRLRSYVGGMLKRRSLWVLAVIWTFGTGAFMAVYQVTPLYLTKELSLSIEHANAVLSLSRLGGVAFGVIMGFLVDRFDLKRSMFMVLCMTGLFTMLMGHANITIVQVGLFLQGTTIMGFYATGLMALSRMFSMEERSVAAGVVSTVSGVFGSALVPYLFGIAGDHISFRFGMVVFGALVALASVLVYFLRIPAAVRERPVQGEWQVTRLKGSERERERGQESS
ncbi:MAG: MFS transporter [Syntrophorhabdales bacterium]|jgi:MFS family permease